MKKLFQGNNKIYCLTNIFVCILCTGYLYTGYCSVNNDVQHDETEQIVEKETEPVSTSKTNKPSQTVVTTAKTNTSSKKYVKPSYDSVTGAAVVSYAKNYLGLRYVSGGNSLTTGTDCSGFTKLIYREFGITLSRSVKAQAKNGTYVKKSDLQKGDLIFYGYKAGVVSHVAIYIGNGKVIHQSTPKEGVKINTMNMMVYITARRVITEPSSKAPNDSNGDVVEDNKNENTSNESVNNNPPTENSGSNDNYTDSEYDNSVNDDTIIDSGSSDNSQEVNKENQDNNTSNDSSNENTPSDNNNDNNNEKVYTNNEYGTGN